jgi:hypothetical protein
VIKLGGSVHWYFNCGHASDTPPLNIGGLLFGIQLGKTSAPAVFFLGCTQLIQEQKFMIGAEMDEFLRPIYLRNTKGL